IGIAATRADIDLAGLEIVQSLKHAAKGFPLFAVRRYVTFDNRHRPPGEYRTLRNGAQMRGQELVGVPFDVQNIPEHGSEEARADNFDQRIVTHLSLPFCRRGSEYQDPYAR